MQKNRFRKLTLIAVMVLLSVMAFSNFAGAIETWHSEIAATGDYYIQDLGFDSAGRPGFVQFNYDSTKAYYRYKSESGWVSELISDKVNREPVLAYDSSGQPAVLFLRWEGSPQADKLILSRRTADDTWVEMTVDAIEWSNGDIGFRYSLAFDTSGRPCVSYVKAENNPYVQQLYYATFNGSTWNKQSVCRGNDIFANHLEFNGNVPAIAFSAGKQGLRYAYLDNGQWNISTVDDAQTSGLRNRQDFITLGFAANGRPVISYYDETTRNLMFAYSLGGDWVKTTLEEATYDKHRTGYYAKMKVVKKGSGYDIFILHCDYHQYQTSSIKVKTLTVNNDSDLVGLNFTSQTVISSGEYSGRYPCLAIGIKDGNPAILCSNYSKTTYFTMEPRLQTVSTVSFDPISAGSSSSREITITNNGSLDLSISEITLSSGSFTISGGGPGILASGQSRVINVTFEPLQASTSYSGTITVKSNDPDNPVYSINLSGRSIGDNADLARLDFSNGASLTYSPEVYEQSLTVEHATKSIKITPTAAHQFATIRLGFFDNMSNVQNGQPSSDIPLEIGQNEIAINVTSENKLLGKGYSVIITRKDSPDASLSGLEVSAGTLSPEFSPDITEYTLILPDGVTEFSLTPTATPMEALGNSTISINGEVVANGQPESLTAAVGLNTYTIHVLAPDNESSMDYVVNVLRLPELRGISVDHGELDKPFDPYESNYTVVVPNSVSDLTITPIYEDCYVYVNGDPANETGSVKVWFGTGENTYDIRVVSLDGETERTYTLTVTRLPGLGELFVGDTQVHISEYEFEYRVEVIDAVSSIVFRAPEGMSVEITGPSSEAISITEDGITEVIPFAEGSNGKCTIELISPLCEETTVYTLEIIRLPRLASLEISCESIELRPDVTEYLKTIPNSVDSVTISVSANAGSTADLVGRANFPIEEDEEVVGRWNASELRIGGSTVYFTVRSGDGEAESTYAIVIYRLPGLSSLAVSEGTLGPAFDVDAYEYTVHVGSDVTSVELSAAVIIDEYTYLPQGCIFVSGEEGYGGTYEGEIPLSYGDNIIPIRVVTDEFYNVAAVYNVNIIREEPEAGTISVNTAVFDKYENASNHKDVSVTVTIMSEENPLVALKNGSSVLVEDTHYTVSGDTYTIKKEYLATLSTGNTSITFDFEYGEDPVLVINVTDSTPPGGGEGKEDPPSGGNNSGGIPTTPGNQTGGNYQAHVSGGGTAPITVDTNAGAANVILETLSDTLLNGIDLVVEVEAIPGVSCYTANIPSSALSSDGGSLTLNTEIGSMTIPGNMLSGTGLEGNVGVTIDTVDLSSLPESVRADVGDRPIIQLTLTLDGTRTEWNNPAALVTVSIPYTPTASELENPEGIVVWYIDGNGNIVSVPNGRYDPTTGTVTFSTTHFSYYAVGFAQVSFDDVAANAWYHKAVSFVAARGIANGTGQGQFSPNAKLTRSMLVAILYRLENEPDNSYASLFRDVASGLWYSDAVAWAYNNGIVSGYGDGRFGPNDSITREQMALMLYNYAKCKGYDITASIDLNVYKDRDNISGWAEAAMKWAVANGLIRGRGDGTLDPTGTAARAEVAEILMRFMFVD